MVCVRFPGSITTIWARNGTTTTPTANRMVNRRRDMNSSSSEPARRGCVRRQFEVAGQVDLDPVTFANRDGGQPIQKSIHRLCGGLRGDIRGAAGDDDRPIS